MIDGAPHAAIEASRELAFTTAVLFNIGINRGDLSEPEMDVLRRGRDLVAHQLTAHDLATWCPQGCGSIQAEVYYSDKYKPLCVDPKSLIEPVIRDLRRCGFIKQHDKILMADTVVSRYANVIYDLDRSAALSTVNEFLGEVGISYCGRYGRWDHAWTDEALINGEESAANVLDRQS